MQTLVFIVKVVHKNVTRSFLYCVVVYFFIRLIRVTQWIELPMFLLNHTTDFLCLPILLPLTVCIIKILKPKAVFKPSILLTLLVATMYSFMFELILPKYSHQYTADPIDVLMYFLGGGFYWLVMMKNHKNIPFFN